MVPVLANTEAFAQATILVGFCKQPRCVHEILAYRTYTLLVLMDHVTNMTVDVARPEKANRLLFQKMVVLNRESLVGVSNGYY